MLKEISRELIYSFQPIANIHIKGKGKDVPVL
jgi:hypothetical protein